MWDTTEQTNMKTKKFQSMEVVPYVAVEWLSQGDQTPNELMVWLEERVSNDANRQKNDW